MSKGAWDLESVYDEQINPLMAQIIAICKEHNIPFVASFAYAQQDEDEEDGGTDLCTSYSNGFDGRTADTLTRALRVIEGRDRIAAFTITTETKP